MSIRSYPTISLTVIHAVCILSLFTLCKYAGFAFRAVFPVTPTPHWAGSAASQVRV
jgi:hypothetical protein